MPGLEESECIRGQTRDVLIDLYARIRFETGKEFMPSKIKNIFESLSDEQRGNVIQSYCVSKRIEGPNDFESDIRIRTLNDFVRYALADSIDENADYELEVIDG
jgi:hypothetical protein